MNNTRTGVCQGIVAIRRVGKIRPVAGIAFATDNSGRIRPECPGLAPAQQANRLDQFMV
jgi:hypothetical protein